MPSIVWSTTFWKLISKGYNPTDLYSSEKPTTKLQFPGQTNSNPVPQPLCGLTFLLVHHCADTTFFLGHNLYDDTFSCTPTLFGKPCNLGMQIPKTYKILWYNLMLLILFSWLQHLFSRTPTLQNPSWNDFFPDLAFLIFVLDLQEKNILVQRGLIIFNEIR